MVMEFQKDCVLCKVIVEAEETMNKERGHRVVCKYCGSLLFDFTWLPSIHIVALEVLYFV